MTDEYRNALEAASTELEDVLDERKRATKRLEELNKRTESLKKTVASLSALLGEDDGAGDESVSLTETIRELLKNETKGLSAIAVRERLRSTGFPIDGYKQPMAVINTTLKRLESQGEVKAHEYSDTKRPYYKWIVPPTTTSTITDDDIPF